MSAMASEIMSIMIVYSIVYSGADRRKHQRSKSLAFVRGIHRWPVNSPHKEPVTRNMFPFDDVIMILTQPQCVDQVWVLVEDTTYKADPYKTKKGKKIKSVINSLIYIQQHSYSIGALGPKIFNESSFYHMYVFFYIILEEYFSNNHSFFFS